MADFLEDLYPSQSPRRRRRPVPPPVEGPAEELRKVVHYMILVCPYCSSRDHRVETSRPPMRYHVCNQCGRRFDSLEVEYCK